jgi:TonB family protein
MEKPGQSEELRRVIRDILGSTEPAPSVEMPDGSKRSPSDNVHRQGDVEPPEVENLTAATIVRPAEVEMPTVIRPAVIEADEKTVIRGKPQAANAADTVATIRLPKVEPPVEEKPDLGDLFPPSEKTKKKRGGGKIGVVLIAGVVIIVAVSAAYLILSGNGIFGFSLFGPVGGSRNASSSNVSAASLAPALPAGDTSTESSSGGETDLAKVLEKERATNAGLRGEINKLTAEIEKLRAAGGQARQTSDLEARIAQLEQENAKLREQSASQERDLAASRSELNVLRSSADKNSTDSEQLQKLDKEYRNVLAGLQEAQAAGRAKDQKIEELQGENNRLRKSVTSTETKSTTEETRSNTSRASADSASGEEVAPVPSYTVKPKYPETAKRRRVQGTVKVRVLVSETGKVLDAKVISSPDPMGSLDRAALEAVREWKFKPGQRGGKPVQMYYDVQMAFAL